MTGMARPKFQKQGPRTNCILGKKELGFKSCTAYAMAMGIDAYVGDDDPPSGCAVRKHTKDFDEGLSLSQVADVAQDHYGVRVTVRTGGNTISPASAAKQCRKGRGFVLQGNTAALMGKLKVTKGGANHAVWVNEVMGEGPHGEPLEALVYDPMADGQKGRPKGKQSWPWPTVLAFAAGLTFKHVNKKTKKVTFTTLGPGKFYAGFVPKPRVEPDTGKRIAVKTAADVVLFKNAKRTTPFPDRTRANPPKGHRVNVRSRPDRMLPGDIVDRVPNGALFIAYQFIEDGEKPPGSTSKRWYGNRTGTEWVHVSGLRRIGGST
jgi:hypothetical protein